MKSQYPWYSNIHMAQLSMISLYPWYPHTYIVTLCLTWLSYQMVTHVTCGHTCHMWLHLSHVVTLIECCQTCHMRPTTKNFVRWLPTPLLKLWFVDWSTFTFLQLVLIDLLLITSASTCLQHSRNHVPRRFLRSVLRCLFSGRKVNPALVRGQELARLLSQVTGCVNFQPRSRKFGLHRWNAIKL